MNDTRKKFNEHYIKSLRDRYPDVYTLSEFINEFEIVSYLGNTTGGFAAVIRKDDNSRGIIQFNSSPRVYFDFSEFGE